MTKHSDTQYSMYVPKLRRGRSEFTVDLQIDYATMKVKESFASRSQMVQQTSTLVTPNSGTSVATNSSLPNLTDSTAENPFEIDK